MGNRGEAILEATPQVALQCYIIFLTWPLRPTTIGWLSITSSALSLCIPNIELYVTEKLKQSKKEKKNEEYEMTLNFKMNYSHSPEEFSLKPHQGSFSNFTDTLQQFSKSSIAEVTSTGLTSIELASIQVKSKDSFGPKSILTNIAVFLPATLFKILSLSFLMLAFDKLVMIGIILGLCLLKSLILIVCQCCCYRETDFCQQIWECSVLSWLSITNLGRGKAAALCRLGSTVYWTIAYTLMLLWILSHPYDVHNLPEGLTEDHFTISCLLIFIICLGWIPLLLDVITATIKYCCCGSSDNNLDQDEKASFWDGAILLEGMKYCCKCCSDSCKN